MEMVRGTIAHFVVRKPNGWGVARVSTDKGSINAAGVWPLSAHPDDVVEVVGRTTKHPRFGKQFKLDSVVTHIPGGRTAMIDWMTMRLPQIGPDRANALVNEFGAELWDVIELHPEKLKVIKGITNARVRDIADAYEQFYVERDLILELLKWGLKANQATAAVEQWSTAAPKIIEDNPYELFLQLRSVDFATADKVALKHLGWSKDSHKRLEAYAAVELQDALVRGDCYLVRHTLARGIASKLKLDQDLVDEMLDEFATIAAYGKRVMLRTIDNAEHIVSNKLKQLVELERKSDYQGLPLPDDMVLDPDQTIAVQNTVDARVAVVTGGPGTGKSRSLKMALNELDAAGRSYALCAPTGKAARRMREATGREAQTIHRLLVWSEGDFIRNAGNPLSEDVIIVDESSMIDINLAASLLDAVDPSRTSVIFVGDANQLPPVGPGAFFRDVIASGVIPVVWLKTLHRAAQESWVCRNAPVILAGDRPELEDIVDFEWWQTPEGETGPITEAALSIFKEADVPAHHVQVLTPMKKRQGGTIPLNGALQKRLNPESGGYGWEIYEQKLTPGDRVMQTRNNYDLEIMNGEVGTIARVDDYHLVVDFDDGPRIYDNKAAEDLQLAYAMTIHKCVALNTIVWTNEGMTRFDELPEPTKWSRIATGEGLCRYEAPFILDGLRKCIRITTKDGYSVTVTTDHKMMAWMGEKYEAINANDLQKGQFLRLALDEGYQVGSSQMLSPPPDVRHFNTQNYSTPSLLTEEVAEFFGLMVADGTVGQRDFRLVKRHADVVDRFRELCSSLFGVVATVRARPGSREGIVSSVFLADWLRSIGGLEPRKKAIPQVILQASELVQAAFLRGLFEDGTVKVREGYGGDPYLERITWSNVNLDMVRLVQIMLLRFGIISSRCSYTDQVPVLFIYGHHAKLFGERIGFVSSFKNKRLGAAAGDEAQHCVPVSPDETVCWDNPQARYYAKKHGHISRSVAAKLDDAVLNGRLRFHHDRIVTMEAVESKAGCVTVPESGRFLQNGFDGCNSQGSEWPYVAVVMHSEHGFMLTRQLLYTAVTRAKKKVYLIGDKKGLSKAIKTVKDARRRTLLADRLRGKL